MHKVGERAQLAQDSASSEPFLEGLLERRDERGSHRSTRSISISINAASFCAVVVAEFAGDLLLFLVPQAEQGAGKLLTGSGAASCSVMLGA